MNLDKLGDRFSDEAEARAYLERARWPEGPVCPHCGAKKRIYKLTPKKSPSKKAERGNTQKRTARKGLWKCGGCQKQFTVTVGTIFESSHISLDKWLLAIHLLCASEKGVSASHLHRTLGVTYKSAWLLEQRIRRAMNELQSFIR
jgi:transposase-like protein